MSPWTLNRLARAVSRGAVFGYPTDTIWGLGCHPLIESSAARIQQIKRRPPGKGLILLSSRIEYCAAYIDADAETLRPIRKPQETPTTWLVPASDFCPAWLHGSFPTVAVRITDHPLLQRICDQLEAPVISTSANRSGRPPVRNALQMRAQFGEELDFIVTGFALGTGRASEIKSLATGEVSRSSN